MVRVHWGGGGGGGGGGQRPAMCICVYAVPDVVGLPSLQAATDLLVRQKHFSVGQPNNEIHITQ